MARKKRNLGKNPYNEENGLFKSLTKLFSGPITQRRTSRHIGSLDRPYTNLVAAPAAALPPVAEEEAVEIVFARVPVEGHAEIRA